MPDRIFIRLCNLPTYLTSIENCPLGEEKGKRKKRKRKLGDYIGTKNI